MLWNLHLSNETENHSGTYRFLSRGQVCRRWRFLKCKNQKIFNCMGNADCPFSRDCFHLQASRATQDSNPSTPGSTFKNPDRSRTPSVTQSDKESIRHRSYSLREKREKEEAARQAASKLADEVMTSAHRFFYSKIYWEVKTIGTREAFQCMWLFSRSKKWFLFKSSRKSLAMYFWDTYCKAPKSFMEWPIY